MTKQLTIGEVCDFVGGSQPPKSTFKYEPEEGYVRLIQTRDYKTDSFVTYIPKKSTKKFCSATDIMIGRYGPPIFQICRGLEGAYNVALMKAVPKDNIKLDYLYYFLKQNSVFEYVDQLSVRTGGQTGVDLDCLRKYPVKLPSIEKQTQIAAVLSALDAKIALNHRINGELEGMAKLLYDYWFVQYDFPLSAAQAAALGKPHLTGKPYRTSGGPMCYNAQLKREIPKGWEVKIIEAILAKEAPSKKVPASEILQSGSIPVIDQSKDFICGFTNDEDALIRGAPKIIFGDHTRILKFINFDFARGADGTQMIASNSESIPPHLFYHSLLKIDLSSYGYARHFKFLKQSNITLPDSNIAKNFEDIVTAHYELIRANTFQNQELTTLRDWLLPMLMNGQVRVG